MWKFFKYFNRSQLGCFERLRRLLIELLITTAGSSANYHTLRGRLCEFVLAIATSRGSCGSGSSPLQSRATAPAPASKIIWIRGFRLSTPIIRAARSSFTRNCHWEAKGQLGKQIQSYWEEVIIDIVGEFSVPPVLGTEEGSLALARANT
jgi:hypothetical protein